jgi:5,5'-dehydrodivanillate O-demethylase
MLTAEENAVLTQVGPDTPMGRLLRWYWQPIAAASQLDENPVMPVKLLGESLVLYRDRRGTLGLVSDTCAHRRVNLAFGIPEQDGLRCPYHGWRYDNTGQCQEMPAESADSTFPERVKIPADPVQELKGRVFAYLGPQPAPLLPNWDLFVEDNVLRDIGLQVVECNWLQMQENDLDPGHVGWLHAYFSNYVLERLGRPELKRRRVVLGPSYRGRDYRDRVAMRYDFEQCDLGIMNVVSADGARQLSRPSIFPNMNSFQTLFMYRMPIDDTHTLHVTYNTYALPAGEIAQQDSIPYYLVPASIDGERRPIWEELDNNGGQDIAAWAAQGAAVDRSKELLGESDRGVIMWRDLLKRQLRVVEDGGEPMNVWHEGDAMPEVLYGGGGPAEAWQAPDWAEKDLGLTRNTRLQYHKGGAVWDSDRFGPALPLVAELHRRIEEAKAGA